MGWKRGGREGGKGEREGGKNSISSVISGNAEAGGGARSPLSSVPTSLSKEAGGRVAP